MRDQSTIRPKALVCVRSSANADLLIETLESTGYDVCVLAARSQATRAVAAEVPTVYLDETRPESEGLAARFLRDTDLLVDGWGINVASKARVPSVSVHYVDDAPDIAAMHVGSLLIGIAGGAAELHLPRVNDVAEAEPRTRESCLALEKLGLSSSQIACLAAEGVI